MTVLRATVPDQYFCTKHPDLNVTAHGEIFASSCRRWFCVTHWAATCLEIITSGPYLVQIVCPYWVLVFKLIGPYEFCTQLISLTVLFCII